jgi:hypothetical protein
VHRYSVTPILRIRPGLRRPFRVSSARSCALALCPLDPCAVEKAALSSGCESRADEPKLKSGTAKREARPTVQIVTNG